MKTFTNTKKISSKLLYDMLKGTFSEFLKDGMNYNKSLGFGITDHTIVILDAKEKELFTIEVTPDLITTTNLSNSKKNIEKKLEEFVHGCLL